MFGCDAVREKMPLLLTESLPPADRESAHAHIEECAACSREWGESRAAWRLMADLPEVPVPPRVRASFVAHVDSLQNRPDAKVLPFRSRVPMRRLAEAAVIAVLVGGSFFAGRTTTDDRPAVPGVALTEIAASGATSSDIQTVGYRIAESSVIPASLVNPNIQGSPNIENVRFFETPQNPNQLNVSFDVTSNVTVTGAPTDRNMVKLLSYFLQTHENSGTARSTAVQWVRDQYTSKGVSDPELVRALANLLKSDAQEGVRIKAVDALKQMPATTTPEIRNALVDALKNDPNPAVRIKAVEALANLARTSNTLDQSALETLRQKATQNDENPYVRVKAAEALSAMNL